MARIRSIKPEIASDAKLAALPGDVWRTFILCITQADDCGLLPGKPRALIGALYPLTDDVTEAKLARWMQQLIAARLLFPLTSADGSAMLCVANWSRHQKIDKPSWSPLSRSLFARHSSNHTGMTKDQHKETLAILADRLAEWLATDSTNDSPNDSPNDSTRRSRSDRGPWTVEHIKQPTL